jgi:hypothetical protein
MRSFSFKAMKVFIANEKGPLTGALYHHLAVCREAQ